MIFRRVISGLAVPGGAYFLYRTISVMWVHDPLPLVFIVPAALVAILEAVERAFTGKRWSA